MNLRTAGWVVAILFQVAGCGGNDDVPGREAMAQLEVARELRIGSRDDPEYSFGWFLHLAVGPGDMIYTVHPETQFVRVHDETGRLVMKIGGEGEGPGKFLNAGPLGFLGDTLWVFDGDTNRLSYFDAATGELIESRLAPVGSGSKPGSGAARPTGLLADGTIAAKSTAWAQLVASGEITEQVVLRWTRNGVLMDTLAVLSVENTMWVVERPDGTFRSYSRQPFADAPLIEWSPSSPELIRVDRTVGGRGSEPNFRVTKVNFAGDTLFDRVYSYEPVPLTDAIIDSVVISRATSIAERTGFTEGQIAEWGQAGLYTPPHLPPVATLTVGMDGSVWLKLADDGKGPATWLGLRPDGSILGEVRAPRSFQLLAATTNRWWGSDSDELETPYIVRYDLVTSGISENTDGDL